MPIRQADNPLNPPMRAGDEGLQYAVLAQRLAGRIPGLPTTTTAAEIRATAVIGGGLMGAAVDDPAIDQMILAYAAKLGIQRRNISDEEIVSRCLLAMINEGARIVSEGVAYRPSDIDVIYLNGYGFPAERGGPMFLADQTGLKHVLATLKSHQDQRHGWAWAPAALLAELAERGGSFGDLSA